MGGSFGIDDYFVETDGDEADDEFDQITNSGDAEKAQIHLAVPPKVYIISWINIFKNIE